MHRLFTIILALFGCILSAQGIFELNKAELIGDFDPASHPDFERLRSPYTNRGDAWLRKATAEAFMRMADAAKEEGISLVVVSATRNRNYQRRIWERKWASRSGTASEKAANILRYSSMPGTSRHHWGTDLDINNLQPDWWTYGEGLRCWKWLNANASAYGFFQPYSGDEYTRLSGYKEERWHWSYYPQSSLLLRAYNMLVDYGDLRGFSGSEVAIDVEVIERYVNGIYPGIDQ